MDYQTAPTLETDRLRLRAYRLDDFDLFAAFYASARSQYADGPVLRAVAWEWFASGAGRWPLTGYGAWTIERLADKVRIGIVSLNYPAKLQTECELGWLLWAGYEGQGYAIEAARGAHRFAVDELKWTSFVSYISRENTQSIRLAEKLGAALDDRATQLVDDETFVYRYTY